MPKALVQVLKTLPVSRRKKVDQESVALIQEQMTLQALRQALGLTQEEMADILETRQANISKVEKRDDMLVSTLRAYIEAMGGTLELVAHLPGRAPVKLAGFRGMEVREE